MSTHHNLIQSLAGGNGELILEFFAKFSGFECALKQAHFVKGDQYNNALPDWDRFADTLNGQLAGITDRDFINARSYLLQAPPKKQMFTKSDKTVRWEKNSKRSKESDERYLLRLVRDVRNNLFHGGKYQAEPEPVDGEALRNCELLKACLTILDKCRSLNADVGNFFEQALR